MTLHLQKRAQIVGMKEAGENPAEIVTHFNVSERTVNHIYGKFKERGTTTPTKSPGRPQKLAEHDVGSLVRYARRNRTSTLSDITNFAAVEVSESTVRRRLH